MSAKALDDFTSARRHTGFDPDAVVALLSSTGLSRADIADVVAADPLFLRSRVDRLGPRLRDLRDSVGLSVPQIARFLAAGGSRLMRRCIDLGPNSQDPVLRRLVWLVREATIVHEGEQLPSNRGP